MTLPTIPESIHAAAWRRWLQSGEDDCRPLLAECINAVWPDLYALAAASLPTAPAAPAVLPEVTDEEATAACDAWYETRSGKGDKGDVRDRRWALVTRSRVEWFDDGAVSAIERTNANDITVNPTGPTGPARYSIDPRTVPSDPDADLVEAMARASWAVSNPECDWDDDTDAPEREDYLADSRVQLAAIRETHTVEPKPTTGPLGGAR